MKKFHSTLVIRYKENYLEVKLVGNEELIKFIDSKCKEVDEYFEDDKRQPVACFYSVSMADALDKKHHYYFTDDLFTILKSIQKSQRFLIV